jgi:hypothetical protein
MSAIFDGLVAIVQYRTRPNPVYGQDAPGGWHAMAAFDSNEVAEKYRDDCRGTHRPWEYRVVSLAGKEIKPPENAAPKFETTSCSQCGGEFGPGDHGFSHCENHQGIERKI